MCRINQPDDYYKKIFNSINGYIIKIMFIFLLLKFILFLLIFYLVYSYPEVVTVLRLQNTQKLEPCCSKWQSIATTKEISFPFMASV